MRFSRSIRAQLALLTGSAVLVVGAALALGSGAWLARELERADREFARHEALEVASALGQLERADDVRELLRVTAMAYFPELGVDGIAVYGLDRAHVFSFEGGVTPLPPDRWELALAHAGEEPVWSPTEDATVLRSATFATHDGLPRWLVVAQVSRARSLESLAQLRRVKALVVPGAAGLAALIAYALAVLALRPVRRLVADARAIAVEGTGRRLAEPPPGSELAELARLLNLTLERDEQAAMRLQRFSADASHELRTPLSRMLGEAEVALRDGRPLVERAALESIVEELGAMRRLVDALLFLARGSTGGPGGQPLDLGALVEDQVAEARLFGEDRGVTITWARPDGQATVRGVPELLGRAVWNLLDNALEWAGPGGRVDVELRPGAPHRVLVSDTGPGVPDEERGLVFEAFFRGRRERERAGFGLGLSLARTIARRHGGELTLAPGGPGACFVLDLPPA